LPQANHASRRRSPKQSFAVRQDAQARVQDLERELRVAEGRDRVALGDALLEGRKAPASEADAFRKSLEGGKRDAEALAYAEERCASELNNLPKQRKEAWLREAERDLKAAGGRYRAAIVELAEAREIVADLAVLVSYLRFDGQWTPAIRGAVLLGRDAAGSNQCVAIDELVAAMECEVDEVAERTKLDPKRPQPEPRQELIHTQSRSWL
jgi:hypothetical protein